MKTVVVVGNPKTNSRTRDAGLRLAVLLGAHDPDVIELADLGSGLLGWGDPSVKAAEPPSKPRPGSTPTPPATRPSARSTVASCKPALARTGETCAAARASWHPS